MLTLLAVGAAPAFADEWRVVPSLEVSESYNDNVNLATENSPQRGDLITTVSPGALVTEKGGRVNFSVSYHPQQLFFAFGSGSNQLRQRLEGTGDAELLRDSLFFRTNASVDQQFVNTAAPVTGTTLTSSSNLQTVQVYQMGPEFRHHFGQYVNIDSTVQYTAVRPSGGIVSDADIIDNTVQASGGQYFGRLGWTLTGEDKRTFRSASSSNGTTGLTNSTGLPATFGTGIASTTRDQLGRADFRYAVTERVSALLGVGYEKIRDPTLLTQPNGLIWDVGFEYKPNSRITLDLTYGRRFAKPNWYGSASYEFLPGSKLTASYSESIQTSQSVLGNTLSNIGIGPNGLPIDTRTGLPISLGNPAFSLTNSTFRQKRFDVMGNLTRERNTFLLDAFDEERIFEVAQVDTTAFGGTFSWIRQLRHALDMNFSVNYIHTDFGGGTGRSDDLYTSALGFTYRISRSITSQLQALRTQRVSNVSGTGLSNNVITLYLRLEI